MKNIIIVILLFAISTITAAPYQQYTLNEKIWFPADPYRLDIKNRFVNIIINKDNTVDCKAANEYSDWFFNQTEKKYAFGELCKDLFVFLQAPFNSNNTYKIIMPHESFHLLAQIKTMRIPMAFAPLERSNKVVMPAVMESFFKFVMSVRNKNVASNCKEFNTITGRLSEDELIYIKWRMFAEWPAVFYTMLESYGEDKIEDFYEDRRKLIPNREHLLYISAIEGFNLIESKFDRGVWQTMLYEGSSLFDMYKYSLGCTKKIYQHQHFVTGYMPNLDMEKSDISGEVLIKKDNQNRKFCGRHNDSDTVKYFKKICGSDNEAKIEFVIPDKKKILNCQFETGDRLIIDCKNKTVIKEMEQSN